MAPNSITFTNNPERSEIPEPVIELLDDLNKHGLTLIGSQETFTRRLPPLHEAGWTFHDLGDAVMGVIEWNLGCTPPPPDIRRIYHLQYFPNITSTPQKWRVYIAERVIK
jgi:hypothetical protein